ncbi:MAG: right-handed parallel beta-helix repeat-containing protein, partial [Deltaproteobacteria bacterium]
MITQNNKAVFVCAMLAMMMTFASAEGDSRVYVAASGKAGNTGSAVAPLADLQEAKEAVRALPRNQPIQVIVSTGTYYLDKPLVFSAVDSGKEGAPVKWQAAEGAVVRLVGGKALKPVWEKQTDKIWKSKVSGCPSIDQLFVNENRQILARYPNYDPSVRYFCGVGATWERMNSWENPETAYIHALHRSGWGGGHIMLERDKEGSLYERMVSIDTTTQGNGARLHDDRRFAENVFEELDAPGEWFFDAKTQTLYYQPAAGVDLKSAKVEAVFNPHLVVFEGSKKNPVHHIELGGFIFNGASPTWEKTTEHLPNGGDFVVHRGGALTMRGTEDCRISNCVFSELGGNAVFIDGYNRRAKVDGNLIKNIGANGISLCGAADSMRGKQFFTVLDETFKNGRLVRNKWVNPGGWSKVPDDLTP